MRSVRSGIWVAAGAVLIGCAPGSPVADASVAPSGSTDLPASEGASQTASPAGCPPGSSPDLAGDPGMARPALRDWFQLAAMDPTGTEIVVGASGFAEGAGSATLESTWTFDLCTNAWTEVGAASLPAPDQRPALAQFVTHPGAGAVLGIPIWLTPVWSYDPRASSWTPIPSTGEGSGAWPMAVHDPEGDRLLAFDPNVLTADPSSTGVLAYDLEQRAWTVLVGPDAPGEQPRVRMDQYDVAFDTAAQQLILVITPQSEADEPGRTWRFDPVARTWSQGADIPNTLDGGYPSNGWAMAFEPVSGRTWLFGDTAMLGYDALVDDWVVAERGSGWPESVMLGELEVDPMARTAGGMVLDPVNDRLVVIGGEVRPIGDAVGGFVDEGSLLPTDDVWAYDPSANNWTLLLAASDEPASVGPG